MPIFIICLLCLMNYFAGLIFGIKYGAELRQEWIGWLKGKNAG